jgi:shikimate kinase
MKSSDKSLVLIGMPGCGKTTGGKMAASQLSIGFVDMDQYIEEKTSLTIPQLFQRGEGYFRDRESESAKDLSMLKNSIISTGGGIVKRKSNMENLHKNGIIVFIDRKAEDIMKDIDAQRRPLLKDNPNAIFDLYKERYSLYKAYSDYTIDNSLSLEDLADKIVQLYKAACKGGCI